MIRSSSSLAAAASGPSNDVRRYLDSFEAARPARSGDPAWIEEIRRAALDRFAELGFPTTRHESWRYTNVAPLAGVAFRTSERRAAEREVSLDGAAIDALTFGDPRSARVVLVNGRYFAPLSRPGHAAGITIEPLAAAMARGASEPAALLARVAPAGMGPFADLNTAMFADGVLVSLARGAAVDTPIEIVHVSTGEPEPGTAPIVSYPRCLVVAGPSSQACLVESFVAAGAMTGFTNAVTEIDVQEGAHVEHIRLQREAPGAWHIGALHARVGRNAALVSHAITLGGRLSRLDVHATLTDEGADVTLNGLYALSGSQHADHHTVLDHAAPHGTSRELYKGVLDDAARGVFDGTVIVRQGAQKTDSRQENRNLLLSPSALVDTRPVLMINADDVKCSHAATIGQMDETSMFYLRSRGLDPGTARRLLIHAFVVDVLQRVKVPALRAGLEGLLFAVPDDQPAEISS